MKTTVVGLGNLALLLTDHRIGSTFYKNTHHPMKYRS